VHHGAVHTKAPGPKNVYGIGVKGAQSAIDDCMLSAGMNFCLNAQLSMGPTVLSIRWSIINVFNE